MKVRIGGSCDGCDGRQLWQRRAGEGWGSFAGAGVTAAGTEGTSEQKVSSAFGVFLLLSSIWREGEVLWFV